MSTDHILRIGSLRGVVDLKEHLRSLELNLPCDAEILRGAESPLAQPILRQRN